MTKWTLLIAFVCLITLGTGSAAAQGPEPAVTVPTAFGASIVPVPLELARPSGDVGVGELSGCTAEQSCPDGPDVTCSGNSSCLVAEYGVRCDGAWTYCVCYNPTCSNPRCECQCYEQYGYGGGLVRCLINCSAGC
jgi:hypothetical protein